MAWWEILLAALAGLLVSVATWDLLQRRHAILRNFPIVGHLRYILEAVGPELRQYIVTDNDSDKPFSRDQRRWVYTSAKGGNNFYGFGTDNDVEGTPAYLIVKQVTFPMTGSAGPFGIDPDGRVPCAKVVGAARHRPGAFRMPSIVNVSGMSYGSLSAAAIEALNKGAKAAGCMHGTGEGGVTPHHQHGADLVWQIGTAYFGCRDEHGQFSLQRFRETVESTPAVRAIEVKLSQGAKPGIGALLPGVKVTREIAAIRGVPVGIDCVSPATHSAFRDADSLLDFVEQLAEASGLPIGIKSAVGDTSFFDELARLMARGDRGVDFVTIDGGEGGTGAGPLVFTDHVAFPFKVGFPRVYRTFVEHGMTDRVVFIGSGKLGLPETGLLAMALGADAVNVGREAMLAIGCIQAQRCHTGRCPTGVTTQSRWRQRGLDPTTKAGRCANYLLQLRRELLQLSHACGQAHPGLVTAAQLDLMDGHLGSRSAADLYGYEVGWGLPAREDQATIRKLMIQ